MGTTRIKVIDLSSDQKEIKTSRKHAQKLASVPKLEKKQKEERYQKPANAEVAEVKTGDAKKTVEQPAVTQDSAADQTARSLEQKHGEQEEPPKAKETPSATTIKKHSLHHKGVRYQAAKKLVEDKIYSAKEALGLLPKTSITKFDPAIEVHINVVDKNIKAKVTFPHAAGGKRKQKTYLVFCDKQIKVDGQKILGGDEKTIAEIEAGKLKPGRDFDTVLSSPKFMPALAKIAKILGPKGLMPNPKSGTILDDPLKYFAKGDDNSTEFKIDPTAPIIHAKIGKLSQGEKELWENLKALIFAIGPSKIQKAILKSTMSPAIKLDVSSL